MQRPSRDKTTVVHGGVGVPKLDAIRLYTTCHTSACPDYLMHAYMFACAIYINSSNTSDATMHACMHA